MKKNIFNILWVMGVLTLAVFCLYGCDNKLDIQQAYSFDLYCMPVQEKIAQDETVEIRCRLVKEGDYQQARYFIRYFQPNGRGELRLDNGTKLLPNDRYPLTKEAFRLYYTSRTTDQQVIDVYIEDGFGQVVQKTFSWKNINADEEEHRVQEKVRLLTRRVARPRYAIWYEH
ncbi:MULTISPECIES: DUF3872 domain-containing protein [Bacteroidales]|uniref:DUF3872 domain-containing protein n=1 Tax=Bacteroidales TaxID=171549 RepID=UPI00359FA9FE